MERKLVLYITTSFLFFLSFIYGNCETSNSIKGRNLVLLADREAPLGWIYLKIYGDNSFEFISKGIREQTIYPGTYKLIKDTLFFNYTDSIPNAGKTAIISNKTVSYIDGSYSESVVIKMNNLTK